MPLLIVVVSVLFVVGYAISARYYKDPLPRIFMALLIWVGLCALALGIFFAGCVLMMKGI